MTFEKLETMFLNGCLHYMGYAMGGHHILAVDMEGKTWRKIPNRTRGFRHYIHQAQGHLFECIVSGRNMSKLSIWILEDYGTNNKWILKHTRSLRKLGYFDFQLCYRAVMVHLEWNLIFFIGVGWKALSSHITWIAEKFMSSLHITFSMVDVTSCQK